MHIAHIKPLSPLVSNKINQYIVHIFSPLAVPKLDSGPSNHCRGSHIWLRLQLEIVPEQCHRWWDSKKGFAKMDKDRYVENGIRGEVIEGYPVEMEQPPQKVGRWQP